jgi:glycosidase
MDLQLRDKTALVTSASTGIGRGHPDVPTVAETGFKNFETPANSPLSSRMSKKSGATSSSAPAFTPIEWKAGVI